MQRYFPLEPANAGFIIRNLNTFWETSATQEYPLGAKFETKRGETFRYAKFAGNVAKGKAAKVATPVATYTTVASGTATVTYDGMSFVALQQIIDTAHASMTIGQYAGWWAVIKSGTGDSQVRRIRTNDATTWYLEDALTDALAVADSALTLIPGCKWENIIIHDNTNKYEPVIGVPQVAVVYASYPYGWVQTKGQGIAITDSQGYTHGLPLVPSDATPGNLEAYAAATDMTVARVIESGGSAGTTTTECLVDFLIE